jgi:carbon starvation protein
MTAGWQKIFSADPRLGFLAHARMLRDAIDSGVLPVGVRSAADAGRMILNDRIDAGVAAFFLVSVAVILIASAHEWYQVLSGKKEMRSSEVPFEMTPEKALAS